MAVIAGVFTNLDQARSAAAGLRAAMGAGRIYLLTPGDAEEVHSVPTTEDMAPVAKYLAFALGAALGLGFGAVLFLFVLDVPTPLAILGMLILAALGAFLLGSAGRGVDESAFQGLPADEVFVYKDALRQGRAIVLIRMNDTSRVETLKGLLEANGAESLDPARKDAWVGVGSAEDLEYDPERSR
jgi:hypothetical protein